MTRKQVAYIAGPISGVTDFRERFAAAEAALLGEGFVVLNPVTLCATREGAEEARIYGRDAVGMAGYQATMRRAFRAVLNADCLFMLPGWLQSNGACREALVADTCGIPCYALEIWHVHQEPLPISEMVALQLLPRGMDLRRQQIRAGDGQAAH